MFEMIAGMFEAMWLCRGPLAFIVALGLVAYAVERTGMFAED